MKENVKSLPIGVSPGVETEILGLGRDGGVREKKLVRNKESGLEVRYQQSRVKLQESVCCVCNKVDGLARSSGRRPIFQESTWSEKCPRRSCDNLCALLLPNGPPHKYRPAIFPIVSDLSVREK